jgi:hypothetical protein
MQGKHLFQWFREHHDLPSQVVEMAKALTKDEFQQRDLIAKVWVMLGEEESYMTHEYYLSRAYATMRDRYERYYMEIPKRNRANDAGIQRFNYIFKNL